MTLRFAEFHSAKSESGIDLLVPQETRTGAASTPAALSGIRISVRVAREDPPVRTLKPLDSECPVWGWQIPRHKTAHGRSETVAQSVFLDPSRPEQYPFRGINWRRDLGAITNRRECRGCSDGRG
jgi:hypothetical protein